MVETPITVSVVRSVEEICLDPPRSDSFSLFIAFTDSNTNGSYYYSNDNGSSYYNSGNGSSQYTAPSGGNTSTSNNGGKK
jgi:hypothetical protein